MSLQIKLHKKNVKQIKVVSNTRLLSVGHPSVFFFFVFFFCFCKSIAEILREEK